MSTHRIMHLVFSAILLGIGLVSVARSEPGTRERGSYRDSGYGAPDRQDWRRGDRDYHGPSHDHRRDYSPRGHDRWHGDARWPEHFARPHGYRYYRFGSDAYYVRHGLFYRVGPAGFYLVRPPLHAIVREVPSGAIMVTFGTDTYWDHFGVFYRSSSGGYIVVEPPLVERRPGSHSYLRQGFQRFDHRGATFWYRDGQFFARDETGLVWVPPPVGAVCAELPAGATSVRYEGDEYFLGDRAVFYRAPYGYEVVAPPWPMPPEEEDVDGPEADTEGEGPE